MPALRGSLPGSREWDSIGAELSKGLHGRAERMPSYVGQQRSISSLLPVCSEHFSSTLRSRKDSTAGGRNRMALAAACCEMSRRDDAIVAWLRSGCAQRFDDWRDENSCSKIIGHEPFGAHFDEKYLWGSAAPDHTVPLRDGSFEGRFPRHFVPGYDRCCPYGTRWQTFRNNNWLDRTPWSRSEA